MNLYDDAWLCGHCRRGQCLDCRTQDCQCGRCHPDAPHLDPCSCDDCVAAAREAQAELEFAALHEEERS